MGEQQKIGLYLFAAVKYIVKVSVQGDPSVADLKGIAARCLPDDQLGAELGAIREWVAAWWNVNARSARDAGLQG